MTKLRLSNNLKRNLRTLRASIRMHSHV